jgi:hypothetical protein
MAVRAPDITLCDLGGNRRETSAAWATNFKRLGLAVTMVEVKNYWIGLTAIDTWMSSLPLPRKGGIALSDSVPIRTAAALIVIRLAMDFRVTHAGTIPHLAFIVKHFLGHQEPKPNLTDEAGFQSRDVGGL